MGETLTQPRRVSDEGPRVVKLCREGRSSDGTSQESAGQLRASSRGNTEGASVARNHWA
jgi:hypothetical protein